MSGSFWIRYPTVLGWAVVLLCTAATCFWAFWGIQENFHEGWYARSFGQNLELMLVQYLSPMLVMLALSLVWLYWPRLGAAMWLVALLFADYFFRRAPAGVLFISVPCLILAVLSWFGRPEPRRLAACILLGLPIATCVAFGAEPAFRVAGRVDDGFRGARIVEGNGVRLVWAPAGPGWPDRGASWAEAVRRCRYLAPDGTHLADTPQDVWRLPTAPEAVRSMARHGRNAGGTWDTALGKAAYRVLPDKETPLWNPHSMIIYWWTATDAGEGKAEIIVYNGSVWPRTKGLRMGDLGFRAVKNAPMIKRRGVSSGPAGPAARQP